jgi:hypothetical protein
MSFLNMRILSPTIGASLRQIPITICNKSTKVAKAIYDYFMKISAALFNFFSKVKSKSNINDIKVMTPNHQAPQEPKKPVKKVTFEDTLDYEQPETNLIEKECSICLEPMSDKDSEFLECVHRFHTTCLNQWLEISDQCPICRTNHYNAINF